MIHEISTDTDELYYAILKWGQYWYIKAYNFKYSSFFGEKILYKLRVRSKD